MCPDIIYFVKNDYCLQWRYEDVLFAYAGEEIVTEMAIVGIVPAPPRVVTVTVTADLDLAHALDRRGKCYTLLKAQLLLILLRIPFTQ